MSDFTTHYVFKIDVEGAQAVQQATQIRNQITQALGGGTAGRGTTAADKGLLAGFAAQLQAAEIQYFGLRRLSYGLQSKILESFGWEKLPYEGGLLDQPAWLIEDLMTINWRKGIVKDMLSPTPIERVK